MNEGVNDVVQTVPLASSCTSRGPGLFSSAASAHERSWGIPCIGPRSLSPGAREMFHMKIHDGVRAATLEYDENIKSDTTPPLNAFGLVLSRLFLHFRVLCVTSTVHEPGIGQVS